MRTMSFTDLFLLIFVIFFLSDSFKSSFIFDYCSEIITVTSPLGLNLKLLISDTFPL